MESLRPDRSYDLILRHLMLALEFVDPLGGKAVGSNLRVTVDGLGPPRLVAGRRFVWLLDGKPEARTYSVKATATDGRFRDFAGTVKVPANDGNSKPHLFGHRLLLQPTGLNAPPAGLTAVQGMLIDDHDPPGGIADAEIRIELRDLSTNTFTASYAAHSDARGGFVAAAPDFDKVVPTAAPPPVPGGPPAPERSVVGWLKIDKGGDVRFTGRLALRAGRLITLAEPIRLSKLSTDPPPP
ncbi:MAG TPA: hypothetical protein VEW26_02505 [Allosphingosinicella sp.]|nr:hypothetical protein [Allosphingosinicella sp.]